MKQPLMQSRRLKALRLFKAKKSQGVCLAEIARRLRVSREAVRLWFDQYKKEGRAGLISKKAVGRPSRLKCEQRKEIRRFFKKRGGGTHRETAEMIERLSGVRYHPAHAARIVKQMQQTNVERKNERALRYIESETSMKSAVKWLEDEIKIMRQNNMMALVWPWVRFGNAFDLFLKWKTLVRNVDSPWYDVITEREERLSPYESATAKLNQAKNGSDDRAVTKRMRRLLNHYLKKMWQNVLYMVSGEWKDVAYPPEPSDLQFDPIAEAMNQKYPDLF